jgi:hypothetical protein
MPTQALGERIGQKVHSLSFFITNGVKKKTKHNGVDPIKIFGVKLLTLFCRFDHFSALLSYEMVQITKIE